MNDRVVYTEPARRYVSTVLLGTALLAGLIVDVSTGGAGHLPAWLAAIVVVVGADAFTVHAARATRSVTLTADEVRVGPAGVARGDIVGVDERVDPAVPVLGRTVTGGMPKGVVGVTVRLADGGRLTVPVRRPRPLLDALGVGVEVPSIRRADPEEYPQLAEVERSSDQLFAVSGFPPLPPPGTARELSAAACVLAAGRPAVGFVRIEIVDGQAHLEQLSVLPRVMRRGIGTALVAAACDWAKEHSYEAITLTTFAEVAWNAPFYARLGFVPVTDLTPELAARREHERELGLDAMAPRVAMRRDLGS